MSAAKRRDTEPLTGSALDALSDAAPAGVLDEVVGHPHAELEGLLDDDAPLPPLGAIAVVRRGLGVSPELRRGIRVSFGFAIAASIGKLTVPILVQQVLQRGILDPNGFRPVYVYSAAALATGVIALALWLSRIAYIRLVHAAEDTLYGLRVRVFEHIHRLSLADHNETKKGIFVSRVTSDIETLARFAQWGAVAWVVDGTLIVGTLLVMFIYSWQLALVVVIAYLPVLPLFRLLQRGQLRAYDLARTRTGDMLSEVSEVVGGAAVVRAYGLEDRARKRLRDRIRSLYEAHMRAALYFAVMFPLGDVFGSIAIAAVTVVAAFNGRSFGLNVSEVVAFLFLTNLILSPIAELSEILDQTQTAIAGWRKVIAVLDVPVDVVEPTTTTPLPPGPLAVSAQRVEFAYREGGRVLHGIDVELPAGANVAVVGETGSGKTTFAKLLCRLADPTFGRVELGGVDLRSVAPSERRRRIRLVPQDGFLFDTTIRENVRLGREGATDDDVEAAFVTLALDWWLASMPDGLDTEVGERGESLSVGERQLVSLARAQLGDAGLLVLDEATSAVDPETERALSGALLRAARGRTTISVAHRLSTAEAADRVLVFDAGLLVEQGSHTELVARGGVYADLYTSWVGNTQARI
ncbi:MAG: ATP-binding cassette, subfamily bacterial [Actinomycetota bacterium]|nr:ATP-binding cassette, subfamily bacterial [Actinomycetota bacterium]